MFDKHREKSVKKIFNLQHRKSHRTPKTGDEITGAFKDERELKRKRKRLTIDWFFNTRGD